jgi:hypothetical protein
MGKKNSKNNAGVAVAETTEELNQEVDSSIENDATEATSEQSTNEPETTQDAATESTGAQETATEQPANNDSETVTEFPETPTGVKSLNEFLSGLESLKPFEAIKQAESNIKDANVKLAEITGNTEWLDSGFGAKKRGSQAATEISKSITQLNSEKSQLEQKLAREQAAQKKIELDIRIAKLKKVNPVQSGLQARFEECLTNQDVINNDIAMVIEQIGQLNNVEYSTWVKKRYHSREQRNKAIDRLIESPDFEGAVYEYQASLVDAIEQGLIEPESPLGEMVLNYGLKDAIEEHIKGAK